MSRRDVKLLLIGAFSGGVAVGLGMLLLIFVLSDISISASWENPDSAPIAQEVTETEPSSSYVLDGQCPVSLADGGRWIAGSTEFQERVGDQVFLFAGKAEQTLFRINPDRYMPVLSGHDIVLAKDGGEQIPGKRVHGVMYSGHVYLFASELTLQKFWKDPDQYVGFEMDKS